MTSLGRGTLYIKQVHTFSMTSEEDTNVKIQCRRTKKETWTGFGIQVRQGSKNVIQLTSGVGHSGETS